MALITKPVSQVKLTIPASLAAADDMVRVNINVSKATRNAWKMRAIQKNMTLTELILEAMSV